MFSTTKNLFLVMAIAMMSEYGNTCLHFVQRSFKQCLLRSTDLHSIKSSDRTYSAMMMMSLFSRRSRGSMLRSLGLNTLGTAQHLPWSIVGLCRW